MSERESVEKNIREFFERYGTEGFLRLYFTNYLFELVMHFIRTEDLDDIRYDSSFRYHFHKEGLVTPEKEEEFKRNIRRECARKANDIVKTLKRRNLIDKMAIGLSEERVAKVVQTSLREVLEKVYKSEKGSRR